MGIHEEMIHSITYKDVHNVMQNGYLFFFSSRNWPFRKCGRKIQVLDTIWKDISVDGVEEFLERIFKKIEEMFDKFVETNKWLTYDPEGKYPMYSLKVYGKKPIMKIKSLLYKKNTIE
jgi:GTPase SAR1 family protein